MENAQTNYDIKLEYIKSQAPPAFVWKEVTDKVNHKIYPFYYLRNFNTANSCQKGLPKQEPFICDYCSRQFTTNYAGYYSAYIVWESALDLKICCNVYRCREGKRAYEYQEQLYGYPEPIKLLKYEDSEPHEMIWGMWFSSGSYAFRLNQFINKGINWQQFIGLVHPSPYVCMAYRRDKRGWIEWNGSKLSFSKDFRKTILQLTKADIIKHVNEILDVNRPTGQLSLFDELFKAA